MRAIVRTQGDDRVPPLNLHDESVDVGDRAQVVERRQPARTDDRLELPLRLGLDVRVLGEYEQQGVERGCDLRDVRTYGTVSENRIWN